MRGRGEATLYAALPVLYLVLFLGAPLLAVLLVALGVGGQGFGGLVALVRNPVAVVFVLGRVLGDVAASPYHRNRIVFTFAQAALSAVVTLAAGLPLAYVFARHDFPGRRFLRALFTVPFVLPAVVLVLALYAYVGPGSVLGLDLLTPAGPVVAIVLAHVVYNTSIVLRVVGAAWERLPTAPIEAARTLGATAREALRRVEVPLLRPSITAALLLVLVFDLTSFGVIFLLGGGRVGTVETLIYDELVGFRPHYATAAVLALLQLGSTFAVLALLGRVQRAARVPLVPVSRPTRRPLRPWGYAVLAGGLLLLTGPLVALVVGSLRYAGAWSLDAYRMLLTNAVPLGAYTPLGAAGRSVLYATLTLGAALPLALLTALALQRARRAAWADGVLFLPLGLSAVVVGLGILLAWDGTFLPDLRASALRVVAAHVLVAFPFAARVLTPTLDAIDPHLREAAQTLGAGRFAVVGRIDVPLLHAALGVAGVYAVGASLGEFGATLLLRRPTTTTLPLAVADAFARVGAPFHAMSLALATLLLAVTLPLFLLVERLRARGGGDLL